MSDQWPEDSNEVPVLKFQDREVDLWPYARWNRGEPYWYERIKGHFLYPLAGAFANPPTTTEGVHLPNPRPLRVVTSAGKEILYLSSEESVGASNGELSSWSNIFAGVLRDLGIDSEEKKKKKTSKMKKKVITIDAEVTSKKGGIAARLLVLLIKTSAAVSKSSGSAGSRKTDVGATPSSIALDEEEEEKEEEEEHAVKLVSRKRSREEAAAEIKAAQKAGEVPLIGKKSKLRTIYKFSPFSAEAQKKAPEKTKGVEIKDPKEPTPKKTTFIIKSSKTASDQSEKEKEKEKVVEKLEGDKSKETEVAATIAHEKAQGPEVVRITGLDQPLHEKEKEVTWGKGPEVV
ncbi:hypothetical protein Hanom_Chr10g00885621 [Helianthus anomalus]